MQKRNRSLRQAACALLLLASLAVRAGAGPKPNSCRETCPVCVAAYNECYKTSVLPMLKGKGKRERQTVRASEEYKAAQKECEQKFKAACKANRAQAH